MKLLTLSLISSLATLSLAQDFETERTLFFNSIGSSVVAAQGDFGFAVSPLVNGMQVRRMGVNAANDAVVNFTILGGQVNPTHATFVSPGILCVAGSIDINGLERMFVARVNVTTSVIDWAHIEPPRGQGTKALQLLDIGTKIVVAAAVEGGIGAIGFDPLSGNESWRTTIPTPLRECGVARDGQENVYLIGNRVAGNSTEMFVRSVNDGGFLRWERAYPGIKQGVSALSFSIPLVTLGLTNDPGSSLLRLSSLDLSDGSVVASTLSPVLNGPLTRPHFYPFQGQFHIRCSTSSNLVRLLLRANSNLTGAMSLELTGSNGQDLAASTVAGVPISLFRRAVNSTVTLTLTPSATWAETEITDQTDPQAFAVSQNNQIYVVGASPLPATSEIRRIFVKPIASDDLFEMFFNDTSLVVNPPGVLANDRAAAGAQLSLVGQPTFGAVTLNSDGSFVFTPTAPKHMVDSFTYRLQRGNLQSLGVVKILRQPIGTDIQLSATRVKGGTPVTGRVVMSGQQQEVPKTLKVFENTTATALSSPTVQLLPGQQLSEPFTVFTARVREPVRAMISADEGNFSVEEIAFLDIDPPFITSLEAIETTVVGGAPAQFRAVMDAPAPTGGMPINVSDDSTAIAVPTIIVIPAGQTSTVFSAPTAVVTSSRTAIVTITSNGISRSVTIAIVGVSMALDPTSVVGGNTTTGTITLTSNAIINSVVFDLSDNSTATAPQTPTAIVPAGFRTGTFTVLTVPVTSTRSATIIASKGGVVRSATMTVRVAALQSILVSPSQVVGGNPFAGLVSLDGRAAGAGLTIGLTSAAVFAQIPASLAIAGGQTQGLFVGTTTRPTTTLMIVISASLNGITRATTIIVSP